VRAQSFVEHRLFFVICEKNIEKDAHKSRFGVVSGCDEFLSAIDSFTVCRRKIITQKTSINANRMLCRRKKMFIEIEPDAEEYYKIKDSK
jgi:hypothetical protein